MAKFMLLINGDRHAWEHMPAEEEPRIEEGHRAVAAAAGAAILGGGELEGASMATSLRSRPEMEPEVADGPFTQATEVVGGYYLIEASDLEEVVRLAAILPELKAPYRSGVEIRRLVNHD